VGRKSSRNRSRQPAGTGPAGRGVLDTATVTTTRPWPAAIATSLAAGVLALVFATVWAIPRVSGDTFMALAGGRDVLAGKLGKPDDWSFNTAGRVWLNQNWGFDAIAFAAEKLGGEDALLILKALLLLAIAASMAAAARTRGANWPATLLAIAGAFAGARWQFELRANPASFLAASLLVLIVYRSLARPHLVWLSVPLLATWADLHGSFMLGFGLVGLWALATGLPSLIKAGAACALRRVWPALTALAAAIALAALVSPFGIANLTEPLTVARTPEWRTIEEWRPPDFTALHGPFTIWELFVLLAVLLAAAGWRWLGQRRAERGKPKGWPVAPELALFDLGLAVAVTAMALSASRFVPLALILLAPLAATFAGPWLNSGRTWLPTAAVVAVLVWLVAPLTALAFARYGSANPRFTHETWFRRMIGADRMPYAASDFLADNDVRGDAFNLWRWEGFLRLRCPRVKLFLGGRAQQVYSLDTLHAYQEILASPRPGNLLSRQKVNLVVTSTESGNLGLVDRLVFSPHARWAFVYCDDIAFVLADLDAPASRALAERVLRGEARFRSAAVGELSRALCRASPALGTDAKQAAAGLIAANRAFPTVGGPWFLLFAAAAARLDPQWLIASLKAEDAALTASRPHGAGSLAAVQARASIAEILAHLYEIGRRRSEANEWANTQAHLQAEVQTLLSGT
jgi:hypothetical protein